MRVYQFRHLGTEGSSEGGTLDLSGAFYKDIGQVATVQ